MTIQQDGSPPPTSQSGVPSEATSAIGNAAGSPQSDGPRPPSFENAAKWSIAGLLILAVMALSFGLGFGLRMAQEGPTLASSTGQTAARAQGAPNFDVLNEIYDDIKNRYIDSGSLDPQALRQGAIDGLIKAVGDPHMGYLSQASFLSETDDTSGSFSGIGATVQDKNGQLVLSPIPNTPAAKGGIKPDDTLLTVDGAPAKGWTTLQAVQKIRGPRGSSVKIGIKHSGGQQEDLSIVRDTINLDSVHSEDLHDPSGKPVNDVGYIRIDQFTLRTPKELQDKLNSFQGKNYKGLVIDLRNNPGGVVDSVISVVGDFVNHDPALIVQSKDGKEQTIRPTNAGIVTQMPLAILVNHNSASAAEIMSGALRDDHRAKIFGETTFGKGTENIFMPLKSDQGGISITVGRWLTPSHTSIEGTGLKPDIAVAAADSEDPNTTYNAVLYRAISYVQTGN
ncbi:MAG: S41 family peptidase [Dehalococcoidia bacterium]